MKITYDHVENPFFANDIVRAVTLVEETVVRISSVFENLTYQMGLVYKNEELSETEVATQCRTLLQKAFVAAGDLMVYESELLAYDSYQEAYWSVMNSLPEYLRSYELPWDKLKEAEDSSSFEPSVTETRDPKDATRREKNRRFPVKGRPTRKEILEVITKRGYKKRMRQWSKKITDIDKVAEKIAKGYAQGKSIDEVADDIIPFINAARSSAVRVARTEMARVHNQMVLRGLEEFQDVLVGYRIINPLDERTRPTHRKRAGTVYAISDRRYKYNAAERPDLPDAPNCRCGWEPVWKSKAEAAKYGANYAIGPDGTRTGGDLVISKMDDSEILNITPKELGLLPPAKAKNLRKRLIKIDQREGGLPPHMQAFVRGQPVPVGPEPKPDPVPKPPKKPKTTKKPTGGNTKTSPRGTWRGKTFTPSKLLIKMTYEELKALTAEEVAGLAPGKRKNYYKLIEKRGGGKTAPPPKTPPKGPGPGKAPKPTVPKPAVKTSPRGKWRGAVFTPTKQIIKMSLEELKALTPEEVAAMAKGKQANYYKRLAKLEGKTRPAPAPVPKPVSSGSKPSTPPEKAKATSGTSQGRLTNMSSRLVVSDTSQNPRTYTAVARGIEAIENVHGIPTSLTTIPVRSKTSTGRTYGVFYRDITDGRPKSAEVYTTSKVPSITTIHELGHYLDYAVIYSGESEAAKAVREVKRKLRGLTQTVSKITDGKGYTTDKYRSYLLSDVEMFARGYSEYIAMKRAAAGDEQMANDLNRYRTESDINMGRAYHPEDLEELEKIFDEMFDTLGWKVETK